MSVAFAAVTYSRPWFAVRDEDEQVIYLQESLDVFADEGVDAAFVYTFARQWLEDEQAVRTAEDLAVARVELMRNGSARIGVSDRILNSYRP